VTTMADAVAKHLASASVEGQPSPHTG
jgi:hypothetical protein